MPVIGDRVGVWVKLDEKTIWLIGFGTFEGSELIPKGPGNFLFVSHLKLDNGHLLNSRDDGCWWGPEDLVRILTEGREVVMVDPDEYRRQKKS